jgi:hypothetical protein
MKGTIAGKVARAAGVLGAVGIAIVTVSAGPAQAAPNGSLKICSEGRASSIAEFPGRGNMTTTIVKSGTCHTFKFGLKPGDRVVVKASVDKDRTFKAMGSFTYQQKTVGFKTVNGGWFML